jgi:Mycobacterium membrane protein
MVVVVVGALAVSRLRRVLSSYVSVPDSGIAVLIIQFEPQRVICEVYGRRGGWLPGLCGAGHSQREMLAIGVLRIGSRKVFR